MRRLAVVGTTGRDAAALAHLRGWVSSLPSAGVAWLDRLAGLPLDHVDLIWLREPVAPDSRLQPWLHAGGRLLATHDAVGVVSSLGLESQLPATLSLPDPPLPDYGLAGFGAHPLFTGLRDGALLGASRHGGRVRCYDEWPEAAVVAVERLGFEVNAGRVLAWEYPVGAGGVLCLGLEPALGAAPGASGDAEVLLANALVGDAIPHRDRVTMAALWPRPGRRAVAAAADYTVVLFLPPSDVWPPSSQPALDLTPAADWTHAGRRLLIRGRAAIGDREVWAPPFRVMHAAAVRDAIACAPGHIAADEVAGGLAVGRYRLQERWLAAADAPVAVWEIAGRDGINVTLEWLVDLRRAWPYPLGSYGDLTFDIGTDHRGLRVQSEGGPRACYAVSGGTLAATPIPGHATIQVTCIGTTPVRIVTAAGIDGEELARALKALEHGVHELAAVRARKAAQLERHGTAFDPPDDLLARGFSWARQRGDEALVGAPGIGRSVLTGCPRSADDGAWCFGAQACVAAAAQLIAGDRDPARELLKFLAQSQRPDGGVPAQLPIGGLGSPPDARQHGGVPAAGGAAAGLDRRPRCVPAAARGGGGCGDLSRRDSAGGARAHGSGARRDRAAGRRVGGRRSARRPAPAGQGGSPVRRGRAARGRRGRGRLAAPRARCPRRQRRRARTAGGGGRSVGT